MSQEPREPSEDILQDVKSGRRDLLKRVLVVLGASLILQPNGGVSGLALAQGTKQEEGKKKKGKKKQCSPDSGANGDPNCDSTQGPCTDSDGDNDGDNCAEPPKKGG